MLTKLRFKFVGVTFLAIMIITAIILGITILENYIISDEQICQIMRLIENNNGLNMDIDDELISEDAVYATRYFVIVLDNNNSIREIDLTKISAVNEIEAKTMTMRAVSAKRNTGYLDNFKFKKIEQESGTKIIFLDCSLQLTNLKSTTEASIAIYMISLVVLFGFLTSVSGVVIKPLIDNIEKQKQFITNAGHELKTPLSIITADLDVLELELGEDNEWIQSMRNQTTRLNRLIRSLLSLSTYDLDSKYTTQEINQFDLIELIQEEIENFKPRAAHKQIIFNYKEPVLIKTETVNIRQLIDLFLDNAIKYTPNDGKIEIIVEKTKKSIRLHIKNTCENAKKINTKRIFERFYRGDKSHNHRIEGYGIGLSIASSIVTKYNGRIRVNKTDTSIEFLILLHHDKKRKFEML